MVNLSDGRAVVGMKRHATQQLTVVRSAAIRRPEAGEAAPGSHRRSRLFSRAAPRLRAGS